MQAFHIITQLLHLRDWQCSWDPVRPIRARSRVLYSCIASNREFLVAKHSPAGGGGGGWDLSHKEVTTYLQKWGERLGRNLREVGTTMTSDSPTREGYLTWSSICVMFFFVLHCPQWFINIITDMVGSWSSCYLG